MTSKARNRLLFVLSDYVTCSIGWLVFNVVRYFSLPPGYEERALGQWLFHDTNILLGQLFYPLMTVLLYAVSGFYNKPGIKSRIEQTGNTVSISLISMLLIFFTALINDNVPERLQNYELMLILWSLLTIPSLCGRFAITNHLIRLRSRGLGIFKAITVGDVKAAATLSERLGRNKRGSDFDIISHTDTDPRNIARAIDEHNPGALILCLDSRALADNPALLADLLGTGRDIYVPLDTYQLIAANPRITSVAAEPLINITSANIPPSTANLKRLGDIFVSALALIVLAPVFAAVAIAIKRDSPGPVFYTQERLGHHKRRFRIIKFRTMRLDAEADGPALSSTDDPRITPLGRTLRKYRIDELPQFWNVLRGEMSLVGPRPEREYFARQIALRAPHYNLIHQVRPGITSWGMVKFGYAGNVDQMIERLRYDMLYLENVSLGVDLKILFYTINTVITGKGI